MEKIIVELEAKTDKALRGIDNVAKSVQDLNKEVVSSNQDTAKSLKNVETSSGQAARGIRGIGNAIKAAGIGLAIAAFATLKDIFMQNQKAADLFNTAFEVVSIAFNDFVGFIVDNSTKVTDFFKSIFDDPKQALIDFADAFKKNIQERFESYLDTLGFLASAVKKVFSGDFAGALEDVKSAGKESLDVLTGVNDTFDKSVEVVTNTTKAVSDYASETVKAAKGNVELAKSAELAAVKNQGLIEKYDRQAEQQRQIRDDESKSIEERIKANEELAEILDKQEEAMLKNADIAVASAKAELDKNKENVQLQKAYQEALNERTGIEAQITGFRSEQQTNTNSLLREQKEIMNEIALFGKSERDKERLELEQQYEANKLLIEKEITDDAEKKERLLALQKDYNAQLKEVNDGFAQEDLDKKKEIADKENEIEERKRQQRQETLSNLVTIAGAETAVGKAALVAKQLLSAKELILEISKTITFSTQAAARSAVAMAEGTAQTAKIGFPKNIPMLIGYAAQAVGIFSAIRSAVRSAKGGATIPNPTPKIAAPPTTSASIPPAFNIVGQSGTNQLASAIGGQSQQPIQAFVVSSEVSTAQELDRNIIEDASIGG
jgi:hypothetical protein